LALELRSLPKLPEIAKIETHIFSGASFQLSIVVLLAVFAIVQVSHDLPLLL
jgi:hypothetical protein